MNKKLKTYWIGIIPVLLLLASGCGNDLEPLTGTVYFNDEPLGTGTITFVSAGTVGTEAAAPPTIAGIKDGQFSIPKQYGLKEGSYRVTIRGYEGVPRGDQMLGLEIFPAYNTVFEYTGQDAAEFRVTGRPARLPDTNWVDPASAQQ